MQEPVAATTDPAPSPRAAPGDGGSWGFAARLLAVSLVVAGGLAVWALHDLLLLVFAAILVACILGSAAGLLSRHTPVPYGVGVAVACLALAGIVGGFIALLGTQITAQLSDLWERLPELIEPLERRLDIDAEAWLDEHASTLMSETSTITRVAGLSSAAAGLLTDTLVVAVAGVYLASDPRLYIDGTARLFPAVARPTVRRTFGAVGDGLQRWLAGQLLAMVVVGVLIYGGLEALGVESALALAVIAAGFEFIPMIGPFIAALPAVALALTAGPETAAWVAILYVAVQQIEGNVMTPLIQQRSVKLPPALALFAILAAALLFGWLGVLLATPLAVAAMIVVREVWMHEVLDETV